MAFGKLAGHGTASFTYREPHISVWVQHAGKEFFATFRREDVEQTPTGDLVMVKPNAVPVEVWGVYQREPIPVYLPEGLAERIANHPRGRYQNLTVSKVA